MADHLPGVAAGDHGSRHIEEAESRIQRGQRNIDIQREAVSELERASQDATIARALLGFLRKPLRFMLPTGASFSKSWQACELAPRGDGA